jgi:tetratricopeptide (TPR) repeat protein
MQRYRVGGEAQIVVTPEIRVHLPHSSLAAALLLAELLQHSGKADDAAKLLETLGSLAPYPSVALSLADLYTDLGRWDDVVRVTDGSTTNSDDLTCQMLRYRAHALRSKGLDDGAMAMLKEALRSKRRDPVLLRQARYERGLTYEAMGKAAYSRRDFEQVYAEDPSFADVASRVEASRRTAR